MEGSLIEHDTRQFFTEARTFGHIMDTMPSYLKLEFSYSQGFDVIPRTQLRLTVWSEQKSYKSAKCIMHSS